MRGGPTYNNTFLYKVIAQKKESISLPDLWYVCGTLESDTVPEPQ